MRVVEVVDLIRRKILLREPPVVVRSGTTLTQVSLPSKDKTIVNSEYLEEPGKS